MSIVALVREAGEARAVVTCAGRLAATRSTDLIIYYLAETQGGDALTPWVLDDAADGEVGAAIQAALGNILRTRRARKGRIPRHAVSVRPITQLDTAGPMLSRLRIESPEFFVAAGIAEPGKKSIGEQIAQKTACDSIVLYGDDTRSIKSDHIVVGTSESPHDRDAIKVAAEAAATLGGRVTAVSVEASIGEQAIEVGERTLRTMLRDRDLEENSRLKVKAVQGEEPVEAMAEEARECDLLLIGGNQGAHVGRLLEFTSKPTIGVFRRAPKLTLAGGSLRLPAILPRLNPTDYSDLYEQLQTGSRWNRDFIVMLSLAAAISTLGLLQNSPAVVIGSMLLAPLMTPMIGMGLALNQGNPKLAYTCFRSIGRGFLAALTISAVIGLITPGSDLTTEVFARTEPNILDLLIALFSGMAAAYALARPSVAGTIAGVAIATALVPPTCSIGISLAYGQLAEALGALFLLVANVLAIILAAAGTFRAMGLSGFVTTAPHGFWVRRVVIGLMVCALAISLPLVTSFMRQVREGKSAPAALAITNEAREVILKHLDNKPGVELLFAGRAGIARDSEPIDVAIILSTETPLPRSEGDELVRIMRDAMQNPDLRVKVACVVAGWSGREADDAAKEVVRAE